MYKDHHESAHTGSYHPDRAHPPAFEHTKAHDKMLEAVQWEGKHHNQEGISFGLNRLKGRESNEAFAKDLKFVNDSLSKSGLLKNPKTNEDLQIVETKNSKGKSHFDLQPVKSEANLDTKSDGTSIGGAQLPKMTITGRLDSKDLPPAPLADPVSSLPKADVLLPPPTQLDHNGRPIAAEVAPAPPVLQPKLDSAGQPIPAERTAPPPVERQPAPRPAPVERPPVHEQPEEEPAERPARARHGKSRGGRGGGHGHGGHHKKGGHGRHHGRGGSAEQPDQQDAADQQPEDTSKTVKIDPADAQASPQALDNANKPVGDSAALNGGKPLPPGLKEINETVGRSPAQHTKQENVLAIGAEVVNLARKAGLDDMTAAKLAQHLVTASIVETMDTKKATDPADQALNNRTVGDGGSSHGLFQAHTGGQGTDRIVDGKFVRSPMSVEDRFTPNKAVDRAWEHFVFRLEKQGHQLSDLAGMSNAQADITIHKALARSQSASDRRYGEKYARYLPQAYTLLNQNGFHQALIPDDRVIADR